MQHSDRGIALAGSGPEATGKRRTFAEAARHQRPFRVHVVSYGAITASGPLWKMLLGGPVPFVINMTGHLGRYETGRTARRHGRRVLLWGRWIRTIRP